jgi:hypothetical protein
MIGLKREVGGRNIMNKLFCENEEGKEEFVVCEEIVQLFE